MLQRYEIQSTLASIRLTFLFKKNFLIHSVLQILYRSPDVKMIEMIKSFNTPSSSTDVVTWSHLSGVDGSKVGDDQRRSSCCNEHAVSIRLGLGQGENRRWWNFVCLETHQGAIDVKKESVSFFHSVLFYGVCTSSLACFL